MCGGWVFTTTKFQRNGVMLQVMTTREKTHVLVQFLIPKTRFLLLMKRR